MAFSHGVAAATRPIIYNVDLTASATEYSQVLPNGCRAFSISIQDGASPNTYTIAFETGKVAGPTAPYITLPATVEYSQDNLYLTGTTIYISSSAVSQVAQIIAWV